MIEKNNRIVFYPNNVMEEMLSEIMNLHGFNSKPEIVRACILFYYQEKISEKLDRVMGKVKDDKKIRAKETICDKLCGEIDDKGNCVYKTYEKISSTKVNVHDVKVPANLLTNDLVDNQYFPSRNDCEKVMKNNEKQFKAKR